MQIRTVAEASRACADFGLFKEEESEGRGRLPRGREVDVEGREECRGGFWH